MIEWIFKHLGVVIAVLVIVVQIVRGIAAQRGEQPPPQAKPDELEAERRTREIQEQIRRRRAERGDASARTEPVAPPVVRPEPSPQTTQMPDPFGGPLKRVLEELERHANPRPEPVSPPPVMEDRRQVELERQRKLAEEMEALAAARVAAERRAVELAKIAAGDSARASSAAAAAVAARESLREDLRDPKALRRAMVLREVLGPPLALR